VKKKDLVATKWSLGEKEINDLMAIRSSNTRKKKGGIVAIGSSFVV
jgi:hypothetical protein